LTTDGKGCDEDEAKNEGEEPSKTGKEKSKTVAQETRERMV
jgi:hypothetical protein